jgi:hypothetical protein
MQLNWQLLGTLNHSLQTITTASPYVLESFRKSLYN